MKRQGGRHKTDRNRRSVYGQTKREVAEKPAKGHIRVRTRACFTPDKPNGGFFLHTVRGEAFKYAMKRRSFETCCEVARVHLLPAFSAV
jgi:hypothetical protein